MANPFLEDFIREIEQQEANKTTFEPEVTQAEKSFLWDVVGSTTWSFLDEAGFGVPGLALGHERAEELGLHPESLTAKITAGFGSLGGFVLGAPMKVGMKALKTVAKPKISYKRRC